MNSISLVRGNIFNSSMQTIVNTVNTVGFMGAGIALEYKRRFPEMYEEYNNLCTSGQLKIGKLYLWKKEIPCGTEVLTNWSSTSLMLSQWIKAGRKS